MAGLLRLVIVSASTAWLAVAPFGRAHSQSGCLATEVAKELFSKAGVPISEASLLLRALTPDSTAESSNDQITQTSPAFTNRNAKQLKAEDAGWAKAQQFVKTLPLTEDNQNCIINIKKIREGIMKELKQRGRENIPETLSPNELRSFRNTQMNQTNTQHYTPNPRQIGAPHHPPGPGISEPGLSTGGHPGTGWCGGTTCTYSR